MERERERAFLTTTRKKFLGREKFPKRETGGKRRKNMEEESRKNMKKTARRQDTKVNGTKVNGLATTNAKVNRNH